MVLVRIACGPLVLVSQCVWVGVGHMGVGVGVSKRGVWWCVDVGDR